MPRFVPGLIRQAPDARDYRFTPPVPPAKLPPAVDLRPQDVPIKDQGALGSCTANATLGLFEFVAQQQGLPAAPMSRLELYYHSRAVEGTVNEDSGCQLRDVFKALGALGVAPEAAWPYDVAKFAVAPPAEVERVALLAKPTAYLAVAQTLDALRGCLAGGRPFVFGFDVFPAFESAAVAKTGTVPMPRGKVLGGHAVKAVGYDDKAKRFLIANSWGPDWGDAGHFTLPYAYVLGKHATDFWTIAAVTETPA